MDLQAFYATFSASGLTLLGLWWVVVDKHPEWFEQRRTARMAYVISLQFMIPATASLLSLVALDNAALWRSIFAVMGVVGIAGGVLVTRQYAARGVIGRGAAFLVIPVYALVVVVAALPKIGSGIGATGIGLEAFLTAAVLLLGLNGVWFFSHEPGSAARPEEMDAAAGE